MERCLRMPFCILINKIEMFFDQLSIFITGILAAVLGAVPFGLVNLSVLDVSLNRGNKDALNIAHGAAFVEVAYGLIAIFAGGAFSKLMDGNPVINYMIIIILIISGMVFFIKKQQARTSGDRKYFGFMKGAFLNLISFQVFLFWMLAITYLSSRGLMRYDALSVILFIAGIWLGKMAVLILYMLLSKRIFAHSQILSRNINRIIGSILFGVAIFQALSM